MLDQITFNTEELPFNHDLTLNYDTNLSGHVRTDPFLAAARRIPCITIVTDLWRLFMHPTMSKFRWGTLSLRPTRSFANAVSQITKRVSFAENQFRRI